MPVISRSYTNFIIKTSLHLGLGMLDDILKIVGNTLVTNVSDEVIRDKLINPKIKNGSKRSKALR